VVANATSWDSSSRQLATLIGPVLGGWLIAVSHGAMLVYVVAALIGLTCVFALIMIPGRFRPSSSSDVRTLSSLAEGLHYLWHNKALIAAMMLDLFAVLLGGATALLPIYARDIFQVGPIGLGWLRAAPSIGAILIAATLAHRPPFRRPGKALLWTVTGFGIATIVLGVSRSFALSFVFLMMKRTINLMRKISKNYHNQM
jgi:MFS family permease